MSKQSFTHEGTEYGSRSEAARALLSQTNPETKKPYTCSEVAKIVGMTPQTVYTQTDEGKAKVAARRAKYRAINLAKTGKYTQAMICDRTKLEAGVMRKLLTEANITCPTAKELAQSQKEAEEAKAKEAEAKKAEKAKAKEEVAPAAAEKNTSKGKGNSRKAKSKADKK